MVGRLQQRGVVQKDERARWFAPALTPEHVGELYELRWLLEPAALARAGPNLPDGLVIEQHADLLAALDRGPTSTARPSTGWNTTCMCGCSAIAAAAR